MNEIKITVCELPDDQMELQIIWPSLVTHVRENNSQLVLLPEMPFSLWIAYHNQPAANGWLAAVNSHENWLERLSELSPAVVCSTRPVIHAGRRLNEAYVLDVESGYRAARHKTYLPDEPGFWEATCYDRGPVSFPPTPTRFGQVGFLICTEIWFTEHARQYARQGVRLLLCPRATEKATTAKWIRGGQVAAVMSGAYCLSSNRSGPGVGFEWGGSGWIAEPDQGELMAITTTKTPFITVKIDLEKADSAKKSYPRYVKE